MGSHLSLRFATFGSLEYENMVRLRSALLREPLGLEFTRDELANEHDSFHVGAYSQDVLVGCLVLQSIDDTTLKMRQVCVDTKKQEGGVGKALCIFSEEYAIQIAYSLLFCHARSAVVDFYKKLGYRQSGEVFEEVGIEHQRMEKNL